MRTNMKKLAALLLAVLMLMSAAGCSVVKDTLAQTLVQGNFDAVYLNKADDNYLKLVDTDKEGIEELYMDGLEASAEGFAYYFDISYLTDEVEAEIIDLYKEILAKTKYTVGDASQVNDTTYAVSVTFEPLDIFELVIDEFDALLDRFNEKYSDVDAEALTEEQYMEIDADYAAMVIELVRSKLPEAGYGDPETMLINVECKNDVWSISESSFADFDAKLIVYP